jgi:hypothetical protein
MQLCKRCNQEKLPSDFNKCSSKENGLSYYCRSCSKEVFKKHVPREKVIVEEGFKFCNSCKKVKSIDNFVRNPKGKGGFYSRCRACCAEISRIVRNVPENKLKLKESAAKYTKENREAFNIKSAARRAKRNSATPPWATDEYEILFMKEIYSLAILREKCTRFKWHVDHIIPLINSEVCGLHCSSNLQLIPAVLNLSKGNKFTGELNGN